MMASCFMALATTLVAVAAHAQITVPTAQVVGAPVATPPGTAVIVQTLPPARWTPQQARQAFDLADADTNGELSRAEAQRLAVMPRSFEEMDLNKDGVLSRAEYEAAFAR